MSSFEKVIIGNAELYCGDCMEVLPTLPKVDAVITDPPYGIGESGGKARTRGKREHNHERKEWDNCTPHKSIFDWIFCNSKDQAIFGANYFTDKGLPPRMGWIYWYKCMGGDFSDGELIFTSRHKALKSFVLPQNKNDRVHPTQKPVGIMGKIINLFPDHKLILDPFMGSGTTGVACINLDRKFIGIEKERKYFDIACRRIEQAQQQLKLWGSTNGIENH